MSNVTITHVTESSVIDTPLNTLWQHVRSLAFDKLTPEIVKSVTYLTGQPGSLSSTVKLVYQCDAQWTVLITGISDKDHTVEYEVIEAQPPISVTSKAYTIICKRVSDTDQTFVEWQTDYSSDVTQEVAQDAKFKKLESFVSMKKQNFK